MEQEWVAYSFNYLLVVSNKLLQDDQRKKIDELNTLFMNAVSNLKINENMCLINQIVFWTQLKKLFADINSIQ